MSRDQWEALRLAGHEGAELPAALEAAEITEARTSVNKQGKAP